MKHMRQLRRQLLAGLIAGLGWAAAAGGALAQTAAAPTAAPVRIGMIEVFSGPLANTGESVFRNLLWRWSGSMPGAA